MLLSVAGSLIPSQRMEIDEAEASDLLSRFVSKDGGRDPPTLRIYELVLYVTGDGNTLFDPARMRLVITSAIQDDSSLPDPAAWWP